MPTTLALDLGTNSIGWGYIEEDNEGNPTHIINAGVRIFEEAVEAKTKASKNIKRRTARLARRVKKRRADRIRLVKTLMVEAKLLPEDETEFDIFVNRLDLNPYYLRTKALDEKLEPFEVGRCLYHLVHRRGFKSNRKVLLGQQLLDDPDLQAVLSADEEAKTEKIRAKYLKDNLSEEEIAVKLSNSAGNDDEEGMVLAAISGLRRSMEASGLRTLGEYIHHELTTFKETEGSEGGIARKRMTDRAMYEEEFDAIWDKQAEFHPVLTKHFKAEVYEAIFHQRPIKPPTDTIGKCNLEVHRNRAKKALLISQDFRIWQTLNNILLRTPGMKDDRKLTVEEMNRVAEGLANVDKMSWKTFRTLAKIPKTSDHLIINLQAGGAEDILGNKTNSHLSKDLGEKWNSMSLADKQKLIDEILTIRQKSTLYKRLKSHWKFGAKEAYLLCIRELEAGTMSFSVKAMTKVLPYLKKGLGLHEAYTASGYGVYAQKEALAEDFLPEPPDLRNPVVNRSMWEVRRVMNAFIKKYGKPDVIRVEMLRDLTLTKKQKEDVEKQQKINEKLNKEGTIQYKALFPGAEPKRTDLIKYRLWKELPCCPYTGQSINIESLFGPDWDIEHIIPYSRCLDDSFANKTLCDATENRIVKKNQTPYEAYHSETNKYAEILIRVESCYAMGPGKKKRFRQEEVDTDKFINRQLTDSAYIAREAQNYLKQLGVDVQVSKGSITSALRHFWGLNTILSEDGVNEKNRADHRHHAIDALVVAFTSRSMLQKLSRTHGKNGMDSMKDLITTMPSPLPDLRTEVQKVVDKILVSHMVRRKMTGALHEETAYGATGEMGVYVLRKQLSVMTSKELSNIRDPHLRKLVHKHLDKVADGREVDKKVLKEAFGGEAPVIFLDEEQKKPVRSVRYLVNSKPSQMAPANPVDGRPTRFHPKGNNYVLLLSDLRTEEPKAEIVSMFDAAKREKSLAARMKSADIVLFKKDTCIVEDDRGDEVLVTVKKFSPMTPVYLVLQALHQTGEDFIFRFVSAGKLSQIKKVVVISPIGELGTK